ncbi:MAG: HupE/UreJ family protein [Burkholderiales bacterium]|nr:HupE/UreJ family protein [Burkholderiales bacterium]PZN05729.1 MAG: urease accessory protein [Pseudomonadota bacterium]
MIRTLASIVLLTSCGTALAHPGHLHAEGFGAGFAHPFIGLDHLLAMLAVGVYAAQRQGTRALLAPALFVLGMLAGAAYALQGGTLPYVEHGIALSVLVIGLLIAFMPAGRAGTNAALAFFACAAVLHGYAHGAELPPGATAAHYMAGFALATALLHGAGYLLGRALNTKHVWRRSAGLAVSAAGAALVML